MHFNIRAHATYIFLINYLVNNNNLTQLLFNTMCIWRMLIINIKWSDTANTFFNIFSGAGRMRRCTYKKLFSFKIHMQMFNVCNYGSLCIVEQDTFVN